MNDSPRVVVAMSGGVDSSVAAALLVEAGYHVTGIMLRLWSEPGAECKNRCCTPDDMTQARRVAGQLNIPFYVLDARRLFRQEVVQAFIEGYARGETPNPCIRCNRLVRWGYLLDQAKAAGAAYLATGHYARIRRVGVERVELLQGRDVNKDQSYALSALTGAQLMQTLLPLGDYLKTEVRALAKRFELPVAEKPDSQDLCFLGSEDYRDFLVRHEPCLAKPGPIVSVSGVVIGEHKGLPFYTIGQRKGLGITAAQPMYVIDKDQSHNTLIVGAKETLGRSEMTVLDPNWVSSMPPAELFRAEVKIRYKAALAWATVTVIDGAKLHVQFDRPLRDITPGQYAVFYHGERVLGGGVIHGAL